MTNNSSCIDYHTTQYIAIAAVNSALAGVSFFACLFVIALILFLKKYLVFTQRLILYLVIATALENLFVATQATVFFPDTEAYRQYCIASGFLNLVTIWSEVFANISITFDLFLRAVIHREKRVEWVYILFIFVTPFLFCWIPFIDLTFGEAGPWCWIRDKNDDEECSEHKLGMILRLALWYVPIYPILLVILIFYIVILISVRQQAKKYEGKFDPTNRKRKQLLKEEITPLLIYPFLFLFFNLFSLINRLYETIFNESNIVLFWLQAVMDPLSGPVIAVAYTLDPDTRRRLHWNNLKGECINRCSRKEVMEYPMVTKAKSDSSCSINDYVTSYERRTMEDSGV